MEGPLYILIHLKVRQFLTLHDVSFGLFVLLLDWDTFRYNFLSYSLFEALWILYNMKNAPLLLLFQDIDQLLQPVVVDGVRDESAEGH